MSNQCINIAEYPINTVKSHCSVVQGHNIAYDIAMEKTGCSQSAYIDRVITEWIISNYAIHSVEPIMHDHVFHKSLINSESPLPEYMPTLVET